MSNVNQSNRVEYLYERALDNITKLVNDDGTKQYPYLLSRDKVHDDITTYNYNKMNKKKHIVKEFFGFKTNDDRKRYLVHVLKNKNIHKCYYEIINTNKVFTFFDIDNCKIKQKDFKKVMNEFCCILSNTLNYKLDLNDFIVENKRNEFNEINSIHIIAKKHTLELQQLKSIANKLKDTCHTILDYDFNIDTRIYHLNRQFCMRNNGKLKLKLNENTNKLYCEVERKFRYSKINVEDKSLYKFSFISTNDNEREQIEIPYYNNEDTLKEDIKTIEKHYLLNENNSILDDILRNKETFRLNESANWIPLAILVKKQNLMDINEFGRKSIVGEWTLEQNLEFFGFDRVNQKDYKNIEEYVQYTFNITYIQYPLTTNLKKYMNSKYHDWFYRLNLNINIVFDDMENVYLNRLSKIQTKRINDGIYSKIINNNIEKPKQTISTIKFVKLINEIEYSITYHIANKYIVSSFNNIIYNYNFDSRIDVNPFTSKNGYVETLDLNTTRNLLCNPSKMNKLLPFLGVYGGGKTNGFMKPHVQKKLINNEIQKNFLKYNLMFDYYGDKKPLEKNGRFYVDYIHYYKLKKKNINNDIVNENIIINENNNNDDIEIIEYNYESDESNYDEYDEYIDNEQKDNEETIEEYESKNHFNDVNGNYYSEHYELQNRINDIMNDNFDWFDKEQLHLYDDLTINYEYLKNNKNMEVTNMLIITESNALNAKFTHDYNFNNHRTKFNDSRQHFICSLESLGKALAKKITFNVIYIDEIISVLNHFDSSTIINKVETFTILNKVINNAKLIMAFDADLTYNRFNKFLHYWNDKRPYTIYHYTHNPYIIKKHKMIIITHRNAFDNKLINAIRANKRVVLVYSSKNELFAIRNSKIYTEFNHINQLYLTIHGAEGIINGEKFHYNNNETNDILERINEFIRENNIRIFGYSPRIKGGVSIQEEFDCRFTYYKIIKCSNDLNRNDGGVTPRLVCQMIFRVRNLKYNNEDYIYCGSTIKDGINQYFIEDTINKSKQNNSYIMQNELMEKYIVKENDYEMCQNLLDHIKYYNQIGFNNPMFRLYELLRTKGIDVEFQDGSEVDIDFKHSELKYINKDYVELDIRNDFENNIFNILYKLYKKQQLEYDEQLFFNKTNNLIHCKITIKFEEINRFHQPIKKEHIYYFKGLFTLDYAFNNYQIINNLEFLTYIGSNIQKYRNINRFKNNAFIEQIIEKNHYNIDTNSFKEYTIFTNRNDPKEITNRIIQYNKENNKEYTISRVQNEVKFIFINRQYKRLMKIYKENNNSLNSKQFNIQKEDKKFYKSILESSMKDKDIKNVLNRHFKFFIGGWFKYDVNKKLYFKQDVIFNDKLLKYGQIRHVYNEMTNEEQTQCEHFIPMDMIEKNELLLDTKKQHKIKRQNNIINGNLLFNKYSIVVKKGVMGQKDKKVEHSNRIEDIFDNSRKLHKATKYKGYVLTKPSKKLKKMIDYKFTKNINRSGIHEIKYIENDNSIRFYPYSMTNQEDPKFTIFNTNICIYYLFTNDDYNFMSIVNYIWFIKNGLENTSKNNIGFYNTDSINNILQNILSFLVPPQYKVMKSINKLQILNDSLKIKYIDNDEMEQFNITKQNDICIIEPSI